MKCTKVQLSENFEKSKFIKFLQILGHVLQKNGRFSVDFFGLLCIIRVEEAGWSGFLKRIPSNFCILQNEVVLLSKERG